MVCGRTLQALSFDVHTPPADAGDTWRTDADRFQRGLVSIGMLQPVASSQEVDDVHFRPEGHIAW
jgi:hypothetical protein